MLFVGSEEVLCYLSVHKKDCVLCCYSKGTVLFFGTVVGVLFIRRWTVLFFGRLEGLCCLLLQ